MTRRGAWQAAQHEADARRVPVWVTGPSAADDAKMTPRRTWTTQAMRLTTAELRAAHDALHRLIACGETGETDYTDADATSAYDKVCTEVRKRDRRSSTLVSKPGQLRGTHRR